MANAVNMRASARHITATNWIPCISSVLSNSDLKTPRRVGPAARKRIRVQNERKAFTSAKGWFTKPTTRIPYKDCITSVQGIVQPYSYGSITNELTVRSNAAVLLALLRWGGIRQLIATTAAAAATGALTTTANAARRGAAARVAAAAAASAGSALAVILRGGVLLVGALLRRRPVVLLPLLLRRPRACLRGTRWAALWTCCGNGKHCKTVLQDRVEAVISETPFN